MRFLLAIIFSSFIFSWSSAQPISSDKLFVNPNYGMVRISPNGKFISSYYLGKKGKYLDLIDLKSKTVLTSLSIGNDNRLDNYYWLDDQTIFFDVSREGKSYILLGKLTKDNTFKLELLSAKGYLVSTLPDQPGKVLFSKKRSHSSNHYDLYVININELIKDNFLEAREIKNNSENVNLYLYDRANKNVIANEIDTKNETVTIKFVSIEGGDWKSIFTIEKTDYQLKPISLIGQNKLAVLSNKDTDKVVLREYDIKNKKLGKIIFQHPRFDLVGASYLKNGVLNSVTYYQQGLKRTRYFDRGKSALIERLAKTFSNQEFVFADNSLDLNLNLLYVNGSIEPGEFFVYDQKKDQMTRLLVPYQTLEGESFAPSKKIAVKTDDGTIVESFLTLPKGIDHSTLLVMPHGGPIGVQERDQFNATVQYYASRGFAVLRINFRGSSGFGKAFQKEGVGEFGKLIEKDISRVVSKVTQMHKFKHMCSIGASYGGYSAAMLAIKHPNKYECVIGTFGIYDIPLLFNSSNRRLEKEKLESIARTVGEYKDEMVDISPVYLYKKLKAPILLIGGRLDDTADFEHTNRFAYLLKKSGHDLETIFYPFAGHGHRTWFGDKHEAARTFDFLIKTLHLKMPDPKTLDKEGRKAIANDFVKIADGYDKSYKIEESPEKAFQFYKKAAAYGHPRSTFSVGSYYHRGDMVKANLNTAVKYYEKAAKLGYDEAFARLGRLYMNGGQLEKNWEKAKINLEKARSLEDSPFNNIRLARFYCLAPDGYKNFDLCLQLMDISQYKKRSKLATRQARVRIRETIAWIIAEAKLSDDEYQKIKNFVQETFELTDLTGELENIKAGTFELVEGDSFNDSDENILRSTSNDILIVDNKKLKFGITFDVDVAGIDSYQNQTAVVVRWIRKTKDGRIHYEQSSLLYGSPKGEWQMLRSFESTTESATWTLEIYNLEKKLIYEKEFFVSMSNEKG